MKRITYFLAAAALVLTGCAKEQFEHPSEQNAPQTASAYNPTVTVDQELNQVTFSLGEKGVIPVWVFQDSAGEFTEYRARDDFRRIFTASGDYKVRMYVMNASGTSPDYVEKSFHIDNTLVDFSKYVKYISGSASRTWRINNAVEAHQACGPDISDPVSWWSAKPDEKEAFGLYNSRMTFTGDGKYTFDPGEDGTLYVNVGVTAAPYAEAGHDADYQVPVSVTDSEYKFTVEGDALMLALPSAAPFAYIPNDDFVKDTRFHLMSLTNSEMVLVAYTATGNNGGSIAWQFILTSKEASAPESPLAGTWVMDSEASGHMACGPDAGNPAGWWSAAPNEKADFGVYDNKLTFENDGTYTFDPGEDGLIYVNWGCATVDGQTHTEPDFTLAWEKQTGKYQFDGETLTLPANFTVGYIPNDASYANPVFTVTELTDSRMVLVSVTDGIAWQFIFKKEGAQGGPDTPDPGTGDLVEGENLWAGAECSMAYWYSAADWSGNLTPAEAEILSGNGLRVVMPEGIGGSEWMGQNSFHLAGVGASKDEKYDFWLTLEADEDMTVTVKLAWEGHDTTNEFFYDNNVQLKAGEPLKYVKASIETDPGKDERNDYDGIVLFVDTGRSPAGSQVKITDIHFQKHIGGGVPVDPGTPEVDYTTNDPSIPASYFDVEGAGNLWRSASISNTYWYSGADWAGGLEPMVFKADDWGGIKVIIPEGIGGNEWMGQTVFHTDIPASASSSYDFCVTVKSDEDINDLTFKLAWEGNDNDHAMFYVNNAKIKAGVPYTFKMKELVPDVDYDKLVLFIDCGRCKAGTAVSFTNFCFQQTPGAASYGENLWVDSYLKETWFSPADWSGGLDPGASYEGGVLKLTVPDGVVGSEWQGQVKINAPVAASVAKQYDFSCKIKADDNVTVTVKLADANDDSNHAFFYDNAVVLEADTPLAYRKTPVAPDQDYAETMLIFDFGRCPAGTAIEVTDIVLREIQ